MLFKCFGQGYGFIDKKLNTLRGQIATEKTRGSPERFLDGRDFTEPAALAGNPVEPEPILTRSKLGCGPDGNIAR